jgi:hypothetical protein
MSINRYLGAMVCAACLTAGLALAGEGGGAAPKASAQAGAADMTTRSEAQTELFELVATSGNGQLTVFLDRYATNEPVTGAKVEVESGNWKAVAQENGDGSYRVKTEQFGKPGRYPLQFTVQAGTDADLMETTLIVAEAAEPDAAPVPWSSGAMWWWGGALVVLTALVTLVLRIRRLRVGRAVPRASQGKIPEQKNENRNQNA